MPEDTQVWAVFDGDGEMSYGYPPSLYGLFVSEEVATAAVERWTREALADPENRGSGFDGLYVVPIDVHNAVAPTPTPGMMTSIAGWNEYMARRDSK